MKTVQQTTLLQGIQYGLCMFGAGFVCGVVRVMALEPAFGQLAAVTIELPIMLVACWKLSRNYNVSTVDRNGWMLSVAAFLTLMGCEVAMSCLVFGKTLPGAVQNVFATNNAAERLGLVTQTLCSFLPCIPSARGGKQVKAAEKKSSL